MVKEVITHHISEKKNIDTVKKADKSRTSNKAVDKLKSNKTDKLKSMDE